MTQAIGFISHLHLCSDELQTLAGVKKKKKKGVEMIPARLMHSFDKTRA